MITATRLRTTQQVSQQSKLSQEIARAQSDISTGRRLNQPSDDPIAAARIAEIRRSQADQTVWSRNLEAAKAIASQADTALGGINDVITRAKELTLAGASQSASPNDRAAIVQELRNLNTTLANYQAQTTPTGQPLFPTDAPLQISGSATFLVAATAKQADVFDGVLVSHGGTSSLSAIISAAADAVSQDDPTARAAASLGGLADIDAAASHLVNQRSAQGVRATQIDSAAEALISSGEQLSEERSSLEDTDVAATVMKLNAKTLSLQAAQQAFAKVNRNTLFDFVS
jgi:flagellar hook-associated protein 3 FlgL